MAPVERRIEDAGRVTVEPPHLPVRGRRKLGRREKIKLTHELGWHMGRYGHRTLQKRSTRGSNTSDRNRQIGRASRRERGCRYGQSQVVAGTLKQKTKKTRKK